jgi:hypothetical protein
MGFTPGPPPAAEGFGRIDLSLTDDLVTALRGRSGERARSRLIGRTLTSMLVQSRAFGSGHYVRA